MATILNDAFRGILCRSLRCSRRLSQDQPKRLNGIICRYRGLGSLPSGRDGSDGDWIPQPGTAKTKTELDGMGIGGTRMQEVSVDRTGLMNVEIETPQAENASDHLSNGLRSPWTPLLKDIEERVKIRGPISLAEFMKIALGHPERGYYMQPGVIGKSGDFTTAPEISQMFGELIGVWFVYLWKMIGMPKELRLVELGPGKGTLMADLLDATKSFPEFCDALSKGGITMVEMSPAMRALQMQALNCERVTEKEDTRKSETDSESVIEPSADCPDSDEEWLIRFSHSLEKGSERLPQSIPIRWTNSFKDACDSSPIVIPYSSLPRVGGDSEQEKEATTTQSPPRPPVFLIAQEFFDALPVYQFEFSRDGTWRERLVDMERTIESYQDGSADQVSPSNVETDKPEELNTPSKMPNQDTALGDDEYRKHHLRLVLAPKDTPACKALLDQNSMVKGQPPSPGDGIEVGAAGAAIVEDIVEELVSCGGCSLIFDYGHDGANQGSLRGIKNHKFVNPLQEPGLIDLSTDVDFNYLKKVAHSRAIGVERRVKNRLFVHGPVTQGTFLRDMHIGARAEVLMNKATDDDHKWSIFRSVKRLCDGESYDEEGNAVPGMGEIYKALAFVSPVPSGLLGSNSERLASSSEDLESSVVPGFPIIPKSDASE